MWGPIERIEAKYYLAVILDLLYFEIFMFSGVLLCVILLVPVFCFLLREIVHLITKNNPNYGKLLTVLDCIVLDGNLYRKYPKSSVVSSFTLETTISHGKLYKLFKRNVLEATVPGEKNKLLFPELRMFLTTKWGFFIWKKDPNFRLNQHIRTVYIPEGESLSLDQIHSELLNKQHVCNKSPWEIVLYRYKSPDLNQNCVVALRWSHAVGDAQSVMQVLVECLAEKPLKRTPPKPKPKQPLWKALLICLYFPFGMLYFFGTQLLKPITGRYICHPWRVFMTTKDAPLAVRFTPQIEMKDIRCVAKKLGVSSSSVLVSIIAGLINKHTKNCSSKNIIMGYVLPKDGHPGGLANVARICVLEVPTVAKTPTQHTLLCHKALENLKGSLQPWYSDFIFWVHGIMWPWLQKPLAVQRNLPTGITNVAGELEQVTVGKEHRVLEHVSTTGPLDGCAGVTFVAFSYIDKLRIGVIGRMNVMDKETLDKISGDILPELLTLMPENNCVAL